MGNAVPDIPRLYTAFAEWISCGMMVLLLGPKVKKAQLVFLAVAYLVLLSVFMELTATVMLLLWIPCMIVAFLASSGFICICNRISFYASVYYAVMSFSVAECMASLEWLIVNCIYSDIEKMPLWFELFAIVLIYGGVVFALWCLLSPRIPRDKRVQIEKKDWIVSIFICILVFGFSNMSFITMAFTGSGQYSLEIGYIRTLVDVAGVSMLYAHFLSLSNNAVRRELDAVQSTLQNQYIQYKQSRESIDALNMKYHDMKHQINILRSMNDSYQRAAFLDRMEADIKAYELQNKTGNSVLDTLLTGKSLYCYKHRIIMTVVADGRLIDFMDAMDISSIFGNALDNAIEATMKIEQVEKRLIHLTVSRVKSFVMIRVQNYYESELRQEKGDYVSTKTDGQMHGYGIKSIRYTAERYGGVVNITSNNNWFELRILIPVPRCDN